MPDERDDLGSQVLERKLATILSADVAEFSRLMAEDEEQTLRTFRGHKKVFESLVPMHRGRIFNTAGDAILAEFGSAVEAVRCATDIQAALRTRNDQLAPSRQVRFRIGINLGDVMLQDQDLMGDGVNVAARLQTAAEPGGICISGSVHDQIRDKLSLSFQSLGEKHYKNIQQPVRTFSISAAEGGGVFPTPKPDGAKGGSAKWIAAGLLMLVLAGGGYRAYTIGQRRRAERHTTPRVPAERDAAGVTAPSAVPAGAYDGVYSGPVCYGKTPAEPERCQPGQGTVSGSKILGRWVVAPRSGITVFLTGDVAASGDVAINLRTQTPTGTVVSLIDLTGKLREGLLDASGSFRNGRRTASLTWRKDIRAPR
jgi:adenylate cyclase